MIVHARCLCGAVAFELEGEPRSRSWCHCGMCRRGVGSTPVAWVTFPRASFRGVAGEPRWFRSSEHARRGFCGSCGCAMLFEDGHYPDELDVTTAVLDEAEQLAPERHIWVESTLSWARMDDGLPRHDRRSDS